MVHLHLQTRSTTSRRELASRPRPTHASAQNIQEMGSQTNLDEPSNVRPTQQTREHVLLLGIGFVGPFLSSVVADLAST
jgi:hypothetical protein